ncbi:MAG TPA: DUF1002 domain-containing protein [Peptostreptococcaceae bacterium]|nr:DUF1002 domain-containing protein [Peptostreptococcaceae bacterium]
MKFKNKFISTLCVASILTFSSLTAFADTYNVVTLGANLSEDQKSQMLNYFGVKDGDAQVLTVTNSEERQYLQGVAPESQIGTKSISSSYVQPLSKGSGLDVETNNLTWVSESMIANALATAGVEDAKVVASAPFKVSGTAALTGIVKGFEKSTGEKIDKEALQTANEELVVTGELGQNIGKDEAAAVINQIKEEVVKQGAKSEDEIKQIIINISNEYNINLTPDQIAQILGLMKNISGLNLDLGQLQGQLQNISSKIEETLGNVDVEQAQGFFNSLMDFIQNIMNSIFDSFK